MESKSENGLIAPPEGRLSVVEDIVRVLDYREFDEPQSSSMEEAQVLS